MKPPFFRLGLVFAALPLLSGCVAALVPLAASGALIGRDKIGSEGSDSADNPAENAALTEAVQTAAVDTASPPTSPSVSPPINSETLAQTEPVETVSTQSGELPADRDAPPPSVAVSQAAELPPAATQTPVPTPDPAPSIAPSRALAPAPAARPSNPADFRAYDVLYGYVDSQTRRDPVADPRQSAMLAAPGSLNPARTDCSIRPPAILLDLDSDETLFDAATQRSADPALRQVLSALRFQEVEIFWISAQPAIAAGAIRRVLVESGLDTQGRDPLLLMRREEDRKQTRRQELAETHCLIAIAGDVRADFDELFLYLKDPTAAQPLEELIGAGWFLTPLPLSEG